MPRSSAIKIDQLLERVEAPGTPGVALRGPLMQYGPAV
jgi:hypothetical protein